MSKERDATDDILCTLERIERVQKLMLLMISEYLAGKPNNTLEIDPNVTWESVLGGHYWALELEYGSKVNDYIEKRIADETISILEMWDLIESGYDHLNDQEKARIGSEAGPRGNSVRFRGFDGNHESDYLGVARFLIEKLNRFSRFDERDLNSHTQCVDGYRRMLEVFAPMRVTCSWPMSSSDIIALLNAQTHP